MRHLSSVVFLLSVGVAVAADDFKPEPGFTLLLNGKDLDGWRTQTGKKERSTARPRRSRGASR